MWVGICSTIWFSDNGVGESGFESIGTSTFCENAMEMRLRTISVNSASNDYF